MTAYGVNGNNHFAQFTTTFNGGVDQGFLDTGSNGIFFNFSTTKTSDGNFYAPSCTLSLSATNTGHQRAKPGSSLSRSQMQILCLEAETSVFFNLGGAIPNNEFDWGLPFFLGRNVYIGIENKLSTINSVPVTGPFWAY